MLNDFFYAIGDFLVWTFEAILEPLGNLPNWLFLLMGFVGAIYWMYRQKKYNEKAQNEGGYQ